MKVYNGLHLNIVHLANIQCSGCNAILEFENDKATHCGIVYSLSSAGETDYAIKLEKAPEVAAVVATEAAIDETLTPSVAPEVPSGKRR